MRGRMAAFCAAMLLVVLTGCDDLVDQVSGVRGSGNVVTETREVSGFNSIAVLGSGDVVVTVDGTESLIVEGEDNILPLLETEVRDGRLELGPRDPISPTEPITYTISAMALEGVVITGSGDVTASGIEADSFEVTITGSGHVEPSGTTGDLSVQISGSGEYAGAALEARIGEVTVSGSGDAVVSASDALDVTISGSGNVQYLGSPTLETNISGSGNVSSR